MGRYTRYVIIILIVLILVGVTIYLIPKDKSYPDDEVTLAEGKVLFTKHCISCHGIQDDGFGPPLGGVTSLLSEKTLLNYIKDPSKVIESGDERSVELQSRYKRIMPPFQHIEEIKIKSILAYIDNQTKLHKIEPLVINKKNKETGLTGRLVPPVKKSGVKIELKEVVQLPLIDSTAYLGISTLRAHPIGDGTLLASDQNGIIYKIKDNSAEIFMDIRNEIKKFQSGPGIATGLGSFDFHPDFLNNGLIYITHAETYIGQQADYTATLDSLQSVVQWVVSEWKMDDVKSQVFKGTHRELLRTHAPNFAHGCQEVAFIHGLDKNDPDYGLLYIGYGDGGSNNIKHPELGHHLKSFLGSILRIDPTGNNSNNGKYGIPESNPFVNHEDSLTIKEIYAYGFRNPHHMSWDKSNGNRMITTDIGEANIEELNIIENGGDYGWPNREGNYGISTLKDLKTVFKLSETELDLYKKPFAQYDHEEGNAISGGYVYEGEIDVLKNKYIFGDIVKGKLFYVNIDSQLSDSHVYELAISEKGKETSLEEMSNTKRLHLRIAYDQINKELYLITKADGKIWHIVNAY